MRKRGNELVFFSIPAKAPRGFEVYLHSIEPEGRKPNVFIRILPQYAFGQKRYVFVRISAYLRYIEPEGGKPSALYQNSGTINLCEQTMLGMGPRALGLGPGAWGLGPVA